MNARRWFYYTLSVVTLAVGLWGLDAQRRLATLPDDFRPTGSTFPARVDGAVVGSRAELELLAQAHAIGSILEVESAGRDATPGYVTTLRLRPMFGFSALAISGICGLFFWVVAVSVFAARVQLIEAHFLFFATILYTLALLIGGVYFPARGQPLAALLPVLRVVATSMLPAVFVSLALVFPRRRVLVARVPALLPAIFSLGGALALWHAVAFLAYVASPSPAAWARVVPAESARELYLIAGVATGCLLLFQGSRRLVLTRERQQTKWLLWGITIGVTPYAFLYLLPKILGGQPVLTLELARLATLTIPIAFTFAVARYQFLDIDIIIRRSVIYALLAGVLVGIYFLLAVLAGRGVRRAFPEYAYLVPVLSAVIPVALFGPTRRLVGKWVDRTFFKIQYGYDRALRHLGAALPQAVSQQEVAQRIERFLEENLAPKKVTVIVSPDSAHWKEGVFTASSRLDDRPLSDTRSLGNFLGIAAPNSTSIPEVERADFSPRLAAEGYRILVPIHVGRSVLGLILLGEKRTERRYLEQDIDLLSRLARDTATALERIGLVQQVIEAATERGRLDQLNRLKSDFLFRVAHDLRTPLTSIAWSTRNLLDGLAGPLEARQSEYLTAIDASSRQLGRLVNNLLEISRLELGSEKIDVTPTDLGAAVEEAVVALGPIAGARDARLTRRLTSGLPRARVNRDKLLEIVTNLVENAVKYAPPGTAIDVEVAADGPGRQRISVRDHGPGVRAEDRERIFERFHQGAESPYSQQRGFGLGLYVVKSYVDLMGGTVTVENHPEGGALFTCSFPVWS